MMICHIGCHPAPLGPYDETFFYQIRLIYLLKSSLILTDSCRYGVGAYRTTLESSDDGTQDLIVYGIETTCIYLQLIQCKL